MNKHQLTLVWLLPSCELTTDQNLINSINNFNGNYVEEKPASSMEPN